MSNNEQIKNLVQQAGVNIYIFSGSACTGGCCHDERALPLGEYPFVFAPSVRYRLA